MARGARLSNEGEPTPAGAPGPPAEAAAVRAPDTTTPTPAPGTAGPTGEPAPERVGHHTRRGISWNLVGAAVTNTLRLVTVVVLGRVLDSRDFGVVAAALSVTVLLQNVRDLGLGPALVQRAALRDLLGFGAGQTVIQLAGILATYGDNFVVGRTFGPAALGYYTRAYDLIKLPSAVFGNVVGNVLFPAFSRLQGDKARLASGFRRVIMVNALVLLPASAALIAVAPEAIRVVMGERWDAAVLPFRILAISMMMRTSYKVAAMVASAAGAVGAVAAANVVYMVCVIAGATLSVRWGIEGVAATTALSLVVVYVHCSYLAMQVSGVPARALLGAHVPGLLLAAVASAAAWPAVWALRAAGAPAALSFAAIAVLGIALALGATALWLRAAAPRGGDAAWLREELARVGRRLFSRLGRRGRRG